MGPPLESLDELLSSESEVGTASAIEATSSDWAGLDKGKTMYT